MKLRPAKTMNIRMCLLPIAALIAMRYAPAHSTETEIQTSRRPAVTATSPAIDGRGTADSPVVVELRPIPESNEQSEQSRSDREARTESERETRTTNSRLVIIGIGQLVVFILQLAVFGYQARKLRQTVDAAAEQAGDTKRSIAEAERAATAMEAVGQSMAANARSVSEAVELQHRQVKEESARRVRLDFETTFFQLLHRFSEVVADLRFEFDLLDPDPQTHQPYRRVVKEGREAIRMMVIYFEKNSKTHPQPTGIPIATYYEELYRDFYNEWQHELGIYFRTLYHIFKLVHTSTLSSAERARYASIARAQLSAYELGLIFYNGLWDEGREGFKPLIQRYGILKHLKKETVLREADLHDHSLYKETAFMNYGERLRFWGGTEPPIDYD